MSFFLHRTHVLTTGNVLLAIAFSQDVYIGASLVISYFILVKESSSINITFPKCVDSIKVVTVRLDA